MATATEPGITEDGYGATGLFFERDRQFDALHEWLSAPKRERYAVRIQAQLQLLGATPIACSDPVLALVSFERPPPLAGPRLFLLARLPLLQLGPVGDTVLPLALGFQHGLLLGLVGKKLDR